MKPLNRVRNVGCLQSSNLVGGEFDLQRGHCIHKVAGFRGNDDRR